MSLSQNGINGTHALNFALLKQNNLGDLTNTATARSNIGLIGSLDVLANPYLNILGTYNGLANRNLSLAASSNPTPNTLVAYDNTEKIVSSSISSPYTGSLAVIECNANDLTNIDHLNCGTVVTNYIQQADPAGIDFKNSYLSNVNGLELRPTGRIYTNYIAPRSGILDFNYASLQAINNIDCSSLITTSAIQPPSIQTDMYQPLTPNGSIKFFKDYSVAHPYS